MILATFWLHKLVRSISIRAYSCSEPALFVHPDKITHLGVEYALDHLAGETSSFVWKTKKNGEVKFNVVTSYADHCYSDKDLPRPDGACIIDSRGVERVFCPSRHAHSLSVPKIISEYMAKPSKEVRLTADRNYSILCMTIQPKPDKGSTFYIFFHMKWHGSEAVGDTFDVELNIESAYAKSRHVVSRRRLPFAVVAEELVFGKR